jgi:hypothetical protein
MGGFLGLEGPGVPFPRMNVGIRTLGTLRRFRRRPGAIMTWLGEAGTPSLATFRLEIAGTDHLAAVELPASFRPLIETLNASTEQFSLLDMMGKLELSRSAFVELTEVTSHAQSLCDAGYLSPQD